MAPVAAAAWLPSQQQARRQPWWAALSSRGTAQRAGSQSSGQPGRAGMGLLAGRRWRWTGRSRPLGQLGPAQRPGSSGCCTWQLQRRSQLGADDMAQRTRARWGVATKRGCKRERACLTKYTNHFTHPCRAASHSGALSSRMKRAPSLGVSLGSSPPATTGACGSALAAAKAPAPAESRA